MGDGPGLDGPGLDSPGLDGPGLQDDRRLAEDVAAEAAQLAQSWFSRRVQIEEKDARDLVSEADREVERLVVARLRDARPDDAIVGEEGVGEEDGRDGGPPPEGRRRWYVDPIDGTTNFLKGLPAWGVSIGLAGPDDELLAGAIAMPLRGGLYSAATGHGATCDGQALHASTETRIDRTLMCYAQSRTDNAWGDGGRRTTAMGRLVGVTLGTRMQGCATADLTDMAAGRMDGMWAGGMGPWDVAAGLVILREAGVRLSDVDGRPVTTVTTAFLASAPAVHDELRALIGVRPAAPA